MDIPPPAPMYAVPLRRPRRSRVPALVAVIVIIGLLSAGATYYFLTHPLGLTGGAANLPPASGPQYSYDQGNLDEALSQIDALLKFDPENTGLLTFKSIVLSQEGSLEFKEADDGVEALALAKQAVVGAGTSSEAYYALGFANEVLQKYTDAHAAYQKAVKLNPRNWNALTGDARVYELEGDAAKAKAGYALALAADSRAYGADLGLGRLKSVEGDLAGAQNSFQKAYDHTSNVHEHAQASYGIGMLSVAAGDFDSAQLSFQTAQALEPAYPSGWLGAGIMYYARSVASSTSSESSAAYLRLSSDALRSAAVRAGLDIDHLSAHPQLSLDIALVDDRGDAAAAFKAAVSAAKDDATIKEAADLKQIVGLLDGYAALVERGSPIQKP